MRLVDTDLTFIDYPSAEHWACIFYFSGCSNACVDCQNCNMQNPEMGEVITDENMLYEIVKTHCKRNETNHVVFSGGDPLYRTNREILKSFLTKYGLEFKICIYTGYSIEDVKALELTNFEFIKCGKFRKELYQPSHKTETEIVLASTNQEFYNSKYEKLSNNGIFTYGLFN